MKYCKMEYVEKEVSKLLYGTAAEPFLSGKDGNELLDMAVSFGINTIDTARNYALAEKSIGKWIRDRNNRKDIVILSKCAHPYDDEISRVNEKDIREDLLNPQNGKRLRKSWMHLQLRDITVKRTDSVWQDVKRLLTEKVCRYRRWQSAGS